MGNILPGNIYAELRRVVEEERRSGKVLITFTDGKIKGGEFTYSLKAEDKQD